jgi:hypothetical protein
MPPPPSSGGASLAGKYSQAFTDASQSSRPINQPIGKPVKRSRSRNTPNPRGTKTESLPSIPGIQWEKKTDRPGFAVWHAPEGPKAHRNTKTYLGYVGKKLLAEWQALKDSERQSKIAVWVAARRAEKGLTELP